VGPEEKHLELGQIERLVGIQPSETAGSVSSASLEEARHHLANCEICRRLVSMEKVRDAVLHRLRSDSAAGPTAECPDEQDIYRLVSRELPETDSLHLMEHAISCDRCATILRRVSEELDSSPTADEQEAIRLLETSRPEWQSSFARRLASESVSSSPPSPSKSANRGGLGAILVSFRWMYATAAVVVV
jgi:hypothetical protein